LSAQHEKALNDKISGEPPPRECGDGFFFTLRGPPGAAAFDAINLDGAPACAIHR
jgi:hypothetical protein